MVIACGQQFSPELIEAIESEAAEGLSRRELSRRICGWLDWRNAAGELKTMSCRKALKELQRKGHLNLPESPHEFKNAGGQKARRGREPKIEEAVFTGSLEQLGGIEIIPVFGGSRRSRIWNTLMARYHYLGEAKLCGAQMRYLIWSDYGWLGGFAFSACSWHAADRDAWIGWDGRARGQNRDYVINNSRFLILPSVEVSNLGSYVLSQCLGRVAGDWQWRFGYEPLLLESFVEEGRFDGGVYRAANWQEVGQTSGSHRQGRYYNADCPRKKIFLYPLKNDCQSRLQQSLSSRALEPAQESEPKEPTDWAEEEFGGVRLPDRRLEERLLTLARDFYASPQDDIPQACGRKSKIKAAYRFMENPKVSMPVLLESHAEATAKRMSSESVVLSVQDTTFLNYSTHPMTQGLGPIGGPSENVIGLVLHDTVAFNLRGTPLGVLDAQCWARESAGSSEKEKESLKWQRSLEAVDRAQKHCPETTIVNVSDRESDIYELFEWQSQSPQERPQLLIRAQHNRALPGQSHLWDYMWRQPVAGTQSVHVPRQGKQPARTADLEIRYDRITLQPPSGKRSKNPVEVWAVYATEANPPKGTTEPLEWLLLTTLPVDSFEKATEKIDWYTLRFQIEVYHRTLKSGCNIEDRQLEFAENLERALAIDMVVAWRIFYMTKLGRETPDLPASVFLEEDQWKALSCYINETPIPPSQPPTLQQAIRMIASLGGFIGRKSDGQPGTETLWRGIQRLIDITTGWQIANQRLAHQINQPVPHDNTYG